MSTTPPDDLDRPDPLKPHVTERGFQGYGGVRDYYGRAIVRVYESSGVTPAIWVRVEPDPERELGASALLDESQIATLIDILQRAKAQKFPPHSGPSQ